MGKLLLAVAVLAILGTPLAIGLVDFPGREGISPTPEKHNPPVEGRGATGIGVIDSPGRGGISPNSEYNLPEPTAATTPKKYDPDELYEQLKRHPRRGPTVPPFFLEAFPLERLKEMANVKELSVLYRGDEKPETFGMQYLAGDKNLGIAVAVSPYSFSSPEEIVNRGKNYVTWKQNSRIRVSEVTLIPVGDFGYLEVWKHTPENIPPHMPPELRAPLLVERADLQFIKGKVWLSIITWNGFLKPEQLVEVAKGFEQLLP